MFDEWFVFRPRAEDERYSFELWKDVPRPPEFEAFGLVLGIHVTAIQRDIRLQRQRKLEAQERMVEYVFKTFRRVVLQERFDGLPSRSEREHVAIVAQLLKMTPQDVERALALAEDLGLGDTV